MSYLNFSKKPHDPAKKTDTWDVRSGGTGTLLGRISWYAPWRRYTYAPAGPQVLDATCMTELAQFCQSETDKQKVRQVEARAEKATVREDLANAE